jgi:hypothetical protein
MKVGRRELIGIGSGPSSYGSDPGEIFRFKL